MKYILYGTNPEYSWDEYMDGTERTRLAAFSTYKKMIAYVEASKLKHPKHYQKFRVASLLDGYDDWDYDEDDDLELDPELL